LAKKVRVAKRPADWGKKSELVREYAHELLQTLPPIHISALVLLIRDKMRLKLGQEDLNLFEAFVEHNLANDRLKRFKLTNPPGGGFMVCLASLHLRVVTRAQQLSELRASKLARTTNIIPIDRRKTA
jgi:hypothetical protein